LPELSLVHPFFGKYLSVSLEILFLMKDKHQNDETEPLVQLSDQFQHSPEQEEVDGIQQGRRRECS